MPAMFNHMFNFEKQNSPYRQFLAYYEDMNYKISIGV